MFKWTRFSSEGYEVSTRGDNLNVCLLKDKLYVFGYTGMCSYKVDMTPRPEGRSLRLHP